MPMLCILLLEKIKNFIGNILYAVFGGVDGFNYASGMADM